MLDFPKLSAAYQDALQENIIPFWLKHSPDTLCGGYFDALTNNGQVISANKGIALQAQQVWAFTWLFNEVANRSIWLDHARHGAAFLQKHGRHMNRRWHGELDRRGRPVSPAPDVLPDCFAAMAFAQLYRATEEEDWAQLAQDTRLRILEHRQTIKEAQLDLSEYHQWRHISEPMMVMKMLLEVKDLTEDELWKELIETTLQEILNEFLDRRLDILRENLLVGGSFTNTPEGRRLSPGLTFQTASYLLDLYTITGNRKMAMQVVSWCLRLTEWAWDEQHSGLVQWVDLKDQPSLFSDWQHRLAWIHLEALSALIKGYFYTHHPECPKWFKRIHDYTFQQFPDPIAKGWHLAVDLNGQSLLAAKATPTHSCYHFIKCLGEISQFLDRCAKLQPTARSSSTFRNYPV